MMRRATVADRARVRKNLVSLRIRPEETGPVYAYANHGRWVADCQRCNGAELVTEGEDFLCGTCGAAGPVVWPSEAPDIEDVLGKRVRAENRNWNPGETVDLLRAENIEAGEEP